MISKLKNEGVTTVIPLWDPLYPILITKEATFQQYYPEWFMIGTGLSDTTAAGRLYDQTQWRHAFGISPLWVTWQTVARSTGAREYHHGLPGAPRGDEGVLVNIYRAGLPDPVPRHPHGGPQPHQRHLGARAARLSADRGSSRPHRWCSSPARTPPRSRTSWRCSTPPTPAVPTSGALDGDGMVMKVNGGKRYDVGEWPSDQPERRST